MVTFMKRWGCWVAFQIGVRLPEERGGNAILNRVAFWDAVWGIDQFGWLDDEWTLVDDGQFADWEDE